MKTLDELIALGCDVDTAMQRCGNDETFYLELVESALSEDRYQHVADYLAASDWKGAFEATHALKGVVSNLGLMPIYRVVDELVEDLRPQEPIEYAKLVEDLWKARDTIWKRVSA